MAPRKKELHLPPPIDDGTPDEVAMSLLNSKPRKDEDWKYLQERRRQKGGTRRTSKSNKEQGDAN